MRTVIRKQFGNRLASFIAEYDFYIIPYQFAQKGNSERDRRTLYNQSIDLPDKDLFFRFPSDDQTVQAKFKFCPIFYYNCPKAHLNSLHKDIQPAWRLMYDGIVRIGYLFIYMQIIVVKLRAADKPR